MTLYCDLYLCSLTFSGELKGSALFKRSRPHLGFTPFIFAPLPQLDLCHIKTISNPYMTHIWVTPIPKIGLWTFLRGFPEPTIEFSDCSAVNHVTSGCLSPRSLFPTAQRFPLPKHVTSGFVTSGSGPITSGHLTSGSGHVTETTIFMVRGFPLLCANP